MSSFKVFWLPAPVFIMGVIATVAGGLAVLFPETLGRLLKKFYSQTRAIPDCIFWNVFQQFFYSRRLPETMEEALNIGSQMKLPVQLLFQHLANYFDKRISDAWKTV